MHSVKIVEVSEAQQRSFKQRLQEVDRQRVTEGQVSAASRSIWDEAGIEKARQSVSLTRFHGKGL
jgi:hypothetical protein